MKEQYETLVRGYYYKENEYVIVKGLHDGIIRAINYKYIDSDGNLNEQLNGLQMFCDHDHNTVHEIIERINNYHDWNEYIDCNNINTDNPEELAAAIRAFYHI